MNAMRQKEKRRSDVPSVFLQPERHPSSLSAPPSPLSQRVLDDVEEERQTERRPRAREARARDTKEDKAKPQEARPKEMRP